PRESQPLSPLSRIEAGRGRETLEPQDGRTPCGPAAVQGRLAPLPRVPPAGEPEASTPPDLAQAQGGPAGASEARISDDPFRMGQGPEAKARILAAPRVKVSSEEVKVMPFLGRSPRCSAHFPEAQPFFEGLDVDPGSSTVSPPDAQALGKSHPVQHLAKSGCRHVEVRCSLRYVEISASRLPGVDRDPDRAAAIRDQQTAFLLENLPEAGFDGRSQAGSGLHEDIDD